MTDCTDIKEMAQKMVSELLKFNVSEAVGKRLFYDKIEEYEDM